MLSVRFEMFGFREFGLDCVIDSNKQMVMRLIFSKMIQKTKQYLKQRILQI